jgi:hypothetical protein
MEKIIGYCGVDSGQILLIDPCYVWSDDFSPNGEPTGGSYDAACRITLGDNGAGEVAGGVVTRTAFGDGSYPVTAEFGSDGRVLRVTIDFDPEPEEETCWFCGDTTNWCDCQEDEDEDEDEDEE